MTDLTEVHTRDSEDTQEAADIGRLAQAAKKTDDLLTSGIVGARTLKFLRGTKVPPEILKLILHVDDLPGTFED